MEVSTSILNVKEENSIQMFHNLEQAKIDYFHIDVMDGEFVEQNTDALMQKYCEQIRTISNIPLDVHLMVSNVSKYIDAYLPYNPNIITFHIEASKTKEKTMELIQKIHENGVKSGIVINPDTSEEEILEYLPFVHVVLVMTVIPGKGGQALMESALEKIKRIKSYIEENNLDTYIEADGGIKVDNAVKVMESGTDMAVAGTAIVNSDDIPGTVKKLKFS
jgi:ribulose-phosphate 3-epimerase